jgi:transcriptional regulator with XRE-family HTH domain
MTPLIKTLQLKGQKEIVVLNAPLGFAVELNALPGIEVHRDPTRVERVGAALAFVTTQAELNAATDAILPKAHGDPIIWFAYPKITSKRYTCEFDRVSGWAPVAAMGFEGTRQVALDEDWSILRLRRVEHTARTYNAAQLIELRTQRGWSQGELARRAGVIQNYISKLENNRIEWPNMYHLQKIANAFGVPLTTLIQSREGDMPSETNPADLAPADATSTSEPTSQMRIFLCHSSSDKPAARDLYQRLKAEGFVPWLDEEDLLPGQNWRKMIPKAVADAHVVVVCMSKAAVTKHGYVQKEIAYALDVASEQPEGTIFLIPVRLEDCVVPDRLSELQWVNLYESRGYEFLLRALRHRAESL